MRHLHVSLTDSTVLGVYLGDLDAALTNQIEVLASRCSSRPDGSNRDRWTHRLISRTNSTVGSALRKFCKKADCNCGVRVRVFNMCRQEMQT